MENIMNAFKNDASISVSHVFTNKPNCHGVVKANKHLIPVVFFTKQELENGTVNDRLKTLAPDLIVLAGFLLKVPESMVQIFPNKIINVHPSLLPKYGGKGMYGKYVHQAVLNNKELQTGISIHYVNEHYDEGNILAQFSVELSNEETLESIQQKVHELEMKHFPEVIKKVLEV